MCERKKLKQTNNSAYEQHKLACKIRNSECKIPLI